jgi:hypothetical protein
MLAGPPFLDGLVARCPVRGRHLADDNAHRGGWRIHSAHNGLVQLMDERAKLAVRAALGQRYFDERIPQFVAVWRAGGVCFC